jgi:hypothetical protein
MIDDKKMIRPEYGDAPREMLLVCETLHKAGEILQTVDLTQDESVKKPLLDGARVMIKNCLDALDGRRTYGLVNDPDPDPDDE